MDHQTRLLETLAQGMLHRHRGPPNDFQRKLEGFLKLSPPTFDTVDDDPIAAKDWLREMEKKLDLTTCTDEECVGSPPTSSLALHVHGGTATATPTRTQGVSHGRSSPRPSVSTTCLRVSWMPRWRSFETSPRAPRRFRNTPLASPA
jgi:hypothetical protein